jgi:hypothetical protein
MLSLEIAVGQANVLAHGTIVAKADEVISIYPFKPASDYKLKLIFTDDQSRDAQLDWKIEAPENAFVITFNRFNHGNGVTNTTPIYVANHLNRKVMLEVASYVIGVAPIWHRVLTFTLLDGGPAQ